MPASDICAAFSDISLRSRALTPRSLPKFGYKSLVKEQESEHRTSLEIIRYRYTLSSQVKMFSRVSAVTFYALSALVILAAATPGNQPITTTITVTAVSDWRLVLESLLITYHDAEPPPLLVPFSSVSSESLFKMSTFCLVSPAPPSPSSALETVAALPRPYAATIMLG